MADAWPGLRRFRAVEKAAECDGVASFVLAPEDGRPLPPFRPGQYLTFSIQRPGDERPLIRCYSFSDAPNRGTYRITVKRVAAPRGANVPPGAASTFLVDRVRVGDVLEARAPNGRFTLTPFATSPLVFLAGGIGITPLMSMLNGLIARGEARDVWLFYGVRSGREHVFREHLQRVARAHPRVRLQVAYSKPEPRDREGRDFQHRGRVTTELVQRVLPPSESEPYTFYVCGPSAMMRDLSEGLEGLGVPRSRVHVEAFGAAAVKPFTRRLTRRLSAKGGGTEVTFSRSGKRATWDPRAQTLLDFAMANGVFIPFACATGHCGTCHTALVEGQVDYALDPQFPVRPGFCLPCVAVPRGPVTLEM